MRYDNYGADEGLFEGIKKVFQDETWMRGINYFNSQKVNITSVDNNTSNDIFAISANVKGSSNYKTRVSIRGDGDFFTGCSCPSFRKYEECKHIAALALQIDNDFDISENTLVDKKTGKKYSLSDTKKYTQNEPKLNVYQDKLQKIKSTDTKKPQNFMWLLDEIMNDEYLSNTQKKELLKEFGMDREELSQLEKILFSGFDDYLGPFGDEELDVDYEPGNDPEKTLNLLEDDEDKGEDERKNENLYRIKLKFHGGDNFFEKGDIELYLSKSKYTKNGKLTSGAKVKRSDFEKVPKKYSFLLPFISGNNSDPRMEDDNITFLTSPELFLETLRKFDEIYDQSNNKIYLYPDFANLKIKIQDTENYEKKIYLVLDLGNEEKPLSGIKFHGTKKSDLYLFLTEDNQLIPCKSDLGSDFIEKMCWNDLEVDNKTFEEFKKSSGYEKFVRNADDISSIENVTQGEPKDSLDVYISDDLSDIQVEHNIYYGDKKLTSDDYMVENLVLESGIVKRDQEKEQKLDDNLKGLYDYCDEFKDSVFYKYSYENIDKFFDELEKLSETDTNITYKQKVKKVSSAGLSLNLNIKSQQDRFDANVDFQIDDKKVEDASKILKSVKTGENFAVLDDGTAIQLKDDIKKAIKEMEELGINESNINNENHKIGKYNIGLLDNNEDVLNYDMDENAQKFKKQLANFQGIKKVQPSKNLNASLRDYQKEGFQWINFLREYNFGGVLADDMGLGKTLQTIAMLQKEHGEKNVKTPSLVVAPTSLIFNWISEIEKFATDIKAEYISNSNDGFEQISKNTDIIVVSYGIITNILKENELNKQFHFVVLDESQNIKNPQTTRAKSIFKLRGKHHLALSGTPIENNVVELWSVFNFLMPGFLGTLNNFKNKYSKATNEELSVLSKKVKPFILRRTKEEVVKDIPPKVENKVYIEMGEKQENFYEKLKNAYRLQINEKLEEEGLDKSRFEVLDALLKLRQACLSPELVKNNDKKINESAKINYLDENIEDMIQNGHNVLIFSQFTEFMGYIKQVLDKKEINYYYIDGQTKPKERQRQVNDFNKGKAQVFLISLKAGGHGLNLTQADYVIHMDPWWNPAVEDQATDRAHRIGQEKTVFVQKLITKNSIEEKILSLQDQKKDLVDNIFSGNFSGSLTKEDINYIFE